MDNSFQEFWHYHSESPPDRLPPPEGGAPQGLKPLAIADVAVGAPQFEISFDTDLRPNHQITLLTEVTGWSREIYGVYWYGAWRFTLQTAIFPKGSAYRFKLDGEVLSDVRQFTSPKDQRLGPADVTFPSIPKRFIHGYENLRVCEDQQQQNVLPALALESVEWDVIIIGSGMGGGTLADALSDNPAKKPRILVLEAGSLEYDTHVDNKPLAAFGRSINGHEVRNYQNADHETQFGLYPQMNFGGRSLFWSGLIPRMKTWELGHWPASVATDLEKGGYEAAEKLMRKHVTGGKYQEDLMADLAKKFTGFEVVDTPRSLHQPEFSEPGGGQPESLLFRSTGTYSSAELLIDSLRNDADPGRGRLTVQCNHLVTELITEGDKVTGVVCQDLMGNRERVFHGKFVVLAAGSLESARLALVSKLEPQDLVGAGLTDHPSYYAPNGGDFELKKSSPYEGSSRHAKIFLYPKKEWENPDNPSDKHWFNVEIVINGQYWNSRHADDDVLKAIHPPGRRSTINFKFIFGSPLMEDSWVRLGGPEGKLSVRIPPNPSGANARNAVQALLKELMEFFQVDGGDPNRLHFGNGGTVNHAGGTLRMESGGKRGVVNENLQFVKYQNLFACDPSVYPYIPAANPSLTLVALALRLSDHLISRL